MVLTVIAITEDQHTAPAIVPANHLLIAALEPGLCLLLLPGQVPLIGVHHQIEVQAATIQEAATKVPDLQSGAQVAHLLEAPGVQEVFPEVQVVFPEVQEVQEVHQAAHQEEAARDLVVEDDKLM